jgi:ParB family transcriptional regulator, chromosome partitioning protein
MPRENTIRNATDSKKRKKLALGRGLDALIPDLEPDEDNPRDYFLCDVDLIHPNRYQPRQHFSDEDLEDLSNSIKTQGIIQPLIVRRLDHGYELVAGERRLRAARKAGLTKVPVLYKDVSDAELLEMSIVENIQREDFNPIEEAEAYHRLITEFKLTQDQAAERVGKSRSAVANFLRLRNLPQQIKDSITDGSLSMGHARALLGVDKKAAQVDIWRKVISRGLSVRETENLVRQLRVEKTPRRSLPSSSEDAYFSDVSADLARRLGTKVTIKRRGKVGKLEIEFYGDDDLDRLLGQLRG